MSLDGLSENQLRYFFKKHDLQLIKKIGSGSFGTVFLANCVKNDYLPFAVKIISKKQFVKHPSLQKYLTSQVNNMQVVKNSHVVKLFQKFQESNYFFLVMEYCELGNLYTYQFTQPDKVFKLNDALKIFIEILKGVNYIHKANVIHRDIKCENILLKKKSKNQGFSCKIGDFGFSKSVQQATKSHCGTPNFMAPEILAGKSYDKSVDIWSLGVILYYMLFGDYPFKGMNLLYDIQVRCSNKYNLIEELSNSPSIKRNKSISSLEMKSLTSLFQQIFIINPQHRIQIKSILQHGLFLNFKQLINKEEQPSTESSDVEEYSNFVFGKIQFVQNVIKQVFDMKILTDQILSKVIELFTLRVQATMLRILYKQTGKVDSNSKNNIRKQISARHQKIEEHIKRNIKLIPYSEVQKQYKLKQKQLNFSANEYFQSFKDDYRIVIGLLFAEIHSSKNLKSAQQKQKLKLKILCCHTINRVFQNGLNQDYWICFKDWLKGKSNPKSLSKDKQLKSSNMNSLKNLHQNVNNFSNFNSSEFDFNLFNKWLEDENRENIVKTISLINSKYYNSGDKQKK